MPSVLKNVKHEHFAHQVAKGVNATEAYICAGYSPNGTHGAASKLQKNADVTSRIEELRLVVAEPPRERAIEKCEPRTSPEAGIKAGIGVALPCVPIETVRNCWLYTLPACDAEHA